MGGRRRTGAIAAGFVAWAVVAAAGSVAADEPPLLVSTEVTEPAEPTLRIEDGTIALTLEETIALALERNLGLVSRRYSRAQSQLSALGAESLYELGLSSALSTSESVSPTISDLDGAPINQSESQSLSLGLGQLLPTGASVSLDWSNNRADNNSVFSTFNPSYSSSLGLRLTQPLLASRGRLVTEQQLRVARTNADASDESFELDVVNLLQQAIGAYWDLVGAVEQLKVSEEGLVLARQLLAQSKLKVEAGLMPPLELVQSEVGVAGREEEVIRSRAAVDDRGDALRRLLSVRSRRFWGMRIRPETRPEVEELTVDLDAAVSFALENRAEIRQRLLALDNLELAAAVARNGRLPQLGLDVGYGLRGVGGTVIERGPDGEIESIVPGDWSDALGQIADGDFDNWSVGLSFRYSLGNLAAETRLATAEIDVERARVELRDLEVQIMSEVHRSVRDVNTARQALESARLSTRLSEQNLEAEQLRYENGLSTSFRVVDIQEDLSAARSREVNAITTYRRALVAFYAATGRLLEEVGVEIAWGDGGPTEGGRP